jgi:hypothetical protein
MNIHKIARLALVRRRELVHDMIDHPRTLMQAADAYGVATPTVRKLRITSF